ncbi:hypothetical protein CH373_13745 [Leptospira perolatii]|uniref:Lipoprotein n=1 Tax=Leptospira perolatii TaxID=2023191 RepID=A0A2M9ZKI1_9LEPT|nr:hypothetical protein [Leptospira perolatii]PJZ69339.1 hypothetical protein CH360_11310 [Leptospira perolatii]PJZ72474.1 hypothetical protein CH373_13745 [Leptospira perolatii]
MAPGFLRFLKFCLPILAIFLTGCFDYEETLTINPDFSGTLEVSYVVPTKKKSDESLIKFLPTRKEEIINRLNKEFFAKSVTLKDYSMQKIESSDAEPGAFKEKAKVSYKVEFSDVTQLEGILLGSVQIRRKERTVYFKREFPSVSKSNESSKMEGEKKVFSETLRLLRNNSMAFRVAFPIASICTSNRGEVNLGRLSYRLPLTDTVERAGNKSWDFRITIVY